MADSLPQVPIRGPGAVTPRQQKKLTKFIQGAEIEVFEHRVQAAVLAEKDIADSEALSDAVGVSLDEEFSILREFQAKAGNSAAKLELLGRKVEIMSTINNRRITRRFS